MPDDHSAIVICHYCGSVCRRPHLQPGEHSRCHICHSLLQKRSRLSSSHILALSLAGLGLWVMAVFLPVFSASASGMQSASSLWHVILMSWQTGSLVTSLSVAIMLLLVPLLELVLLSWLCLFAHFNHKAPCGYGILRVLDLVKPWGMTEVWVLGIIVAVVKLGSLFDLHIRAGTWSMAALMMIVLILMSWDRQHLVNRLYLS